MYFPCLGLLTIASVFHLFVVIQYDLAIFLFYSLGRGVFATKLFSKGGFLLVYRGELITGDKGSEREDLYNPHLGSFLFFFKDGSKCLW